MYDTSSKIKTPHHRTFSRRLDRVADQHMEPRKMRNVYSEADTITLHNGVRMWIRLSILSQLFKLQGLRIRSLRSLNGPRKSELAVLEDTKGQPRRCVCVCLGWMYVIWNVDHLVALGSSRSFLGIGFHPLRHVTLFTATVPRPPA